MMIKIDNEELLRKTNSIGVTGNLLANENQVLLLMMLLENQFGHNYLIKRKGF